MFKIIIKFFKKLNLILLLKQNYKKYLLSVIILVTKRIENSKTKLKEEKETFNLKTNFYLKNNSFDLVFILLDKKLNLN